MVRPTKFILAYLAMANIRADSEFTKRWEISDFFLLFAWNISVINGTIGDCERLWEKVMSQ